MSMALSHISLVVVLFITTGVVAHVRQGDGLLYSARGARNDSGGCTHQRGFVGVGITCAVPAGEYDAGKNCGRCVRVEAYLDGALMQTPSIGPLFATVVDVSARSASQAIWRLAWPAKDRCV